MKQLITLLTITILTSYGLYGQKQHSGCLVNVIEIGTGRNPVYGTLYPYSSDSVVVTDPSWKITMVPQNTIGITAPFNAEMINPGWWQIPWVRTSGLSRAISFRSLKYEEALAGSTGFHRNYDPAGGKPVNGALPVRFTRTFYVDAAAPQKVTFSIIGFADDIMFIRADALPGQPIYNTPADSNNIYFNPADPGNTEKDVTKTLILSPGMHTLDIDLYDTEGGLTGINVEGIIKTEEKVLAENICPDKLTIDIGEIQSHLPPTIMYNLADSAKFHIGRSGGTYGEDYLLVWVPVTPDDSTFIYSVKKISNPTEVEVYLVRFFAEENDSSVCRPQFYGRKMWINFQDWHVYGVWINGCEKTANYLIPVKLANSDWEQCAMQNGMFYLDSNNKMAVKDGPLSNAGRLTKEKNGCVEVDSTNSLWGNLKELFEGLNEVLGNAFKGKGDFLDGLGRFDSADNLNNGLPDNGWGGQNPGNINYRITSGDWNGNSRGNIIGPPYPTDIQQDR